jgi:hypothetical protein
MFEVIVALLVVVSLGIIAAHALEALRSRPTNSPK